MRALRFSPIKYFWSLLCVASLCLPLVVPAAAAAAPAAPDLTPVTAGVPGYPLTFASDDAAWLKALHTVTVDENEVDHKVRNGTVVIPTITKGGHDLVFKASGYKDADIPLVVEADSGPVWFTAVNETAAPAKTVTYTEKALRALFAAEGEVNDYSSYNTFPTFKYVEDVQGITLTSLLSRAGTLKVGNSNIVTVTASDSYTGTFMWKDLFKDTRYCFKDGTSTAGAKKVPAVIDFFSNMNTDRGKLFFGQLVPQEQTNDNFVKSLRGGSLRVTATKAGAWAPVTKSSPANGSKVTKGQKVTFTLPEKNGRAKVYYTTDGSTPTVSSKIYNYSEWVDPSEFALSIAKDGTTTIKTKVIGRGAIDSEVTTFKFTVGSGGDGGGDGGGVIPDDPDNPSPPKPTGKVVLTVKDGKTGSTVKLTDTQLASIARSEGNKHYRYSAYNTFPTARNLTAQGPTVAGILSAAGIRNPSPGRLLRITSSDGFETKITYGDMTTKRYYFPNWTKGTQNGVVGGAAARSGWTPVPAVIATNHENGTFAFGQRQPNEQTYDGFVKQMFGGTITLESGGAPQAPSVTKTSPQTTKVVKVGDSISLLLPTNIGRAKVYYTTDGSTPGELSTMYNVSNWKQSGGPADKRPVIRMPGKTTLKVVVIGRGMTTSPVTEFTFSTNKSDIAGASADASSTGAPAAASAGDAGPQMPGSGDGSSAGNSFAEKLFGKNAPKLFGVNLFALIGIALVCAALGAVASWLVTRSVIRRKLALAPDQKEAAASTAVAST